MSSNKIMNFVSTSYYHGPGELAQEWSDELYDVSCGVDLSKFP